VEWLIERFAAGGAKDAFVHRGRHINYGGVAATVSRFGERLAEEGINRGETVAILSDYSPETFCLILALARNGNVVIPLSRESVIERDTALAISGCHWMAEFDEEGISAQFSRHLVASDNEVLGGFLRNDRPGLILFSSGSTGKPKAILHDFDRVADKFRKPRTPVVAIPFLMIDHFGGINTILAITSSLGTVVTVADRSISNICRAIETYRVELLPATPSFLTMLVASNLYRDFDLSSLKRITYGTEVMPQSTLDRLRKIFPDVELQQTYGLSEVGVLRSKSRDDGSLWVRIGGEGFGTKIVDDILWIKSDYAMVGYLNAPSEFDADGWFNTQDRVEVDGEWFRILGRVTDLINVGGQKVYPAEVEDVILTLEDVEDVAVYGEPHPLLGQIVVAKVLTGREEDLAGLKQRIRAGCREKLAPFKVPAKVLRADGPLYTSRQKKNRKAAEAT
jgi:acyl-CoA synthetase (AMP-forming)/AMP-acid ligase II